MTRTSLAKVLFIVVALASAFATHGQPRIVTESEIDDLVKAATDARSLLAYRFRHSSFSARPTETEETQTSVSIFEWVASDRWRHIIEYRPSSTSDLIRREMIRIGDKRFASQASGDWTVTPASSSDSHWGEARAALKVDSVECRYMGTEAMSGKTVDVFRKVAIYRTEQRSGPPTLGRMTTTFWFDKKGLLIKEDRLFDNAANTTPRTRYLWEYEYDPTIRIEQPVITNGTPRR